MYEVNLDLFDENLEPVSVTVFYKLIKDECANWDYCQNTIALKEYYISEIQPNIRATKNGLPYKITGDDMDAWDSEISDAVNKDAQKLIQSMDVA